MGEARMRNTEVGRHVLARAYESWQRLAPARERRRRYVRYTYGDQWSDPALDRQGHVVTEGDLVASGGRRPLTNNLIRRMVKSVVGRWRQMSDDIRECDDGASGWKAANETCELDARSLEEFLISGMAVQHVGHGADGSVKVEAVSPDAFFVSGVRDARCSDMEMVGRLLSLTPSELMMRFSHGDRRRAMELKRLYGGMTETACVSGLPTIGIARCVGGDFYHAEGGYCRVIEVWTLESAERWLCHDPLTATFRVRDVDGMRGVDALNESRRRQGKSEVVSRWYMRTMWRCRMFAPDGTVLDEYSSPLAGGGHPFAVKLYPLVDGDVHSLVEDVLEQQRYVNTLITMMDRMMGTAAKGALLFPVGCKPEGVKWEDVAGAWSDPGGIIPYHPSMGAEPRQVVTQMADIGARDMLKTQIGLFEDVSGVSSALMGKAQGSGVGHERFESEVREATVAVLDLMRTFDHFVRVRDGIVSRLI